MIIKVQLALNDPNAPALVYNEDRSYEVHVPVTEPLEAMMRGRPKVFFHALMLHDELLITQEAPWQDW